MSPNKHLTSQPNKPYYNSTICEFLEDLTDEMVFFVKDLKNKPRQAAFFFLNFMMNFFTLHICLANLLDYVNLDDEKSRDRFLKPFNRFFIYIEIMEKMFIDIDNCKDCPYLDEKNRFLNKDFSKVMERFGYQHKDFFELLRITKFSLEDITTNNGKKINLHQFANFKITFLTRILGNIKELKQPFEVPTIYPTHWESIYKL